MKYFKYKFIALVLIIGAISMSSSCEKPDPEPDPPTTGKLKLTMDFYNGTTPQLYDTMIYTNAAGNLYKVTDIQFFITRLTIYKDGKAKVLNKWSNEHYFDAHISTTLEWAVADEIEAGNYDSLNFTFGFKDEDNTSFMFVNPPENIMVWTERNGGGYHYLKIEGKWLGTSGYNRGFAFHLGRGQIYDANGDITGYIDNSFEISLPNSAVAISAGKTTELNLRMHVNQWFENPQDYDHNQYGGDIMQNQDAMSKACGNGWNVFEVVQ